MLKVISNTSPMLYLYRIDAIALLPKIFCEIWIPKTVYLELQEGKNRGYNVPEAKNYDWLKIVDPRNMPSEWLALDLGVGELATMALALENPDFIVLLDDALARRTAQAAGLQVWGTLKVMLEAKKQGFVEKIKPHIDNLVQSGMWISEDIRQRILFLADER